MEPIQYLKLKLPVDGTINEHCNAFPSHVNWPVSNATTLHIFCAYLQRLEQTFTTKLHGIQWQYTDSNGAFVLSHGTCTLLHFDGTLFNNAYAPFMLKQSKATKTIRIAACQSIALKEQQSLMWHTNTLIDLVQHLGTHDSPATSFVQTRLPITAVACNTLDSKTPQVCKEECDTVARASILRLLNFFTTTRHGLCNSTHTASAVAKIAYCLDDNCIFFFENAAETDDDSGSDSDSECDDEFLLKLTDIDDASRCQLHYVNKSGNVESLPFPYTVCVPPLTHVSTMANELNKHLVVKRLVNADDADDADDALRGVQTLVNFIGTMQ